MKKVVLLLLIIGLLVPTFAWAERETVPLPQDTVQHWDEVSRIGEMVATASAEAVNEALETLSSGDMLIVNSPNFMLPLTAVLAAHEKGVTIGGQVTYEDGKTGVHGFSWINEAEIFSYFPDAQMEELYIGAYYEELSEEEAAPYVAEFEAQGFVLNDEPLRAIGFAFIRKTDAAVQFIEPDTSYYPLCVYTTEYTDVEAAEAYYSQLFLRAWNGDIYRSYALVGTDKETGDVAIEGTYRYGQFIEASARLGDLPYADRSDPLFSGAIEWAYEKGLLLKWPVENGLFEPDRPVTFPELMASIAAYDAVPPVNLSNESMKALLMEDDAFAASLDASEDRDALAAYLVNFPMALKLQLNAENARYEPGLFDTRGRIAQICSAYYAQGFKANGLTQPAMTDEDIDAQLRDAADQQSLSESDRTIAAFCLKNGLLALDGDNNLRWDEPMTRGELCEAFMAFSALQSAEYAKAYDTETIEYAYY